ncbi:MAG TPA: Dabb family protein [Nocardioidaceae bacterium]|nr:Dabb family protein [Nocardioidaceae bacterium]
MTALRGSRIRHLVVFTLRHEEGSPDAETFLAALRSLATIDGVEGFEVTRQVGLKNGYQLAVTMEFASRAAYDAYNDHPDHLAFLSDRWDADVTDFLEIDLAELRPDEAGRN